MIFIVIAFVVLLVSLVFCGAEAWYERDWPRDMGKFAIYAALVLILCASAFGQRVRYDYGATTVTGSGNLLPVLALPYAQVKFYSCSGTAVSTCNTLLTTYTSATGSACSTATQVVLNGTTTCGSVADGQGNFGAWLPASGTYGYAWTIVAAGITYGPFQFTVGASGSSSGLTSFQGRTAPAAVLILADVNTVLQSAANCKIGRAHV